MDWDTTWNCQSGRLSDSDPVFSIWDDDDEVCFAPVSDSFASDLVDYDPLDDPDYLKAEEVWLSDAPELSRAFARLFVDDEPF